MMVVGPKVLKMAKKAKEAAVPLVVDAQLTKAIEMKTPTPQTHMDVIRLPKTSRKTPKQGVMKKPREALLVSITY